MTRSEAGKTAVAFEIYRKGFGSSGAKTRDGLNGASRTPRGRLNRIGSGNCVR